MHPLGRIGIIYFGAGLFLGSVYFFFKNQDLTWLSASLVNLKTPAEEIDLSVSRVFNSPISTSNPKKLVSLSAPVSFNSLNVCQPGKFATSSVYVNEIAWMGSGSDAKAEWLELKNYGAEEISLADWQLLDKTQNIKLFMVGGILPNSFRVFKRGVNFTGTINNSDEVLSLFNSKCELVDKIEAAPAWPAGKSDGRTAERGSDLTWHTSIKIGGTPNAENSNPNPNNFLVSSTTSTSTLSTYTSSGFSNEFGPVPPSMGGGGPNKVLISEVMVGNDASGSYEFIELYNAGSGLADLSGWSIKKLSSTGSESSLVSKARLEEKKLPSGKYLLLTNEKGYIGAPTADLLWPGSYSLAYKENGINLYNAEGKKVDELYWPEIPKNQSYQRASWDSATFKLSSPTPQNSQN